jgi:hypothetical protein
MGLFSYKIASCLHQFQVFRLTISQICIKTIFFLFRIVYKLMAIKLHTHINQIYIDYKCKSVKINKYINVDKK